jgi:hypothetical protein
LLAAHTESSSSLKPGHARPNPTALSHHSHGRSTHKFMRTDDMEGVHEETPHVVPHHHQPHSTSARNNYSTTQRRQRQPLVALVGVLLSTQLSSRESLDSSPPCPARAHRAAKLGWRDGYAHCAPGNTPTNAKPTGRACLSVTARTHKPGHIAFLPHTGTSSSKARLKGCVRSNTERHCGRW